MLTENLRLLRLLGRGGMGTVWLAEHLVLKHEVAVKLLSPELTKDAEALERFRREATAVACLRSAHVVAIHDLGTAEDTPFFVMERLEGEDLGRRLARAKKVPIGTVGAIVVQTCKALARVHELGIVHRDLKPGNVFLTDVEGDLVVKLLDFGVAKTRDAQALHQTSDQALLGTPLYMSPEQVMSTKNVGPATDLWALAVVAYECLVGRPPFDGETVGAIHVAIANGRYTPICTVDPSLPRSLDPWFARAFADAPSQRFASAREMADAFLAAARGDFATTPWPPGDAAHAYGPASLPAVAVAAPPPPARPEASRLAAPLAAGAIVLAMIAVALAVVGRSGGAPPPRETPVVASATDSASPAEPSGLPEGLTTVPRTAEPSATTEAAPSGTVPAMPASALPTAGAKARPRKDRGF
jgi:eukaryotic-like serine/threonine-protein kinase